MNKTGIWFGKTRTDKSHSLSLTHFIQYKYKSFTNFTIRNDTLQHWFKMHTKTLLLHSPWADVDLARSGCHQTGPLAHWVFRPFTWPPLLTHSVVGRQWWPSHCPSPISGFQLNSSLWFHNQQEALSAASPHPVSCCLSLLPCHSNGCEHLPRCLSRKASPADLDQELPCLTLPSPAVVQKVLVFSISTYFSHPSLHGTVRYMAFSKPLCTMLSLEGSVGFLLSDWFTVYTKGYFNTASRCRSVTIHFGTRRDIF